MNSSVYVLFEFNENYKKSIIFVKNLIMIRNSCLVLLSVFVFNACQTDPMPGLEKAFADNPSKSSATALISALQQKLVKPIAGQDDNTILETINQILSSNAEYLDVASLSENLGSATVGIDSSLARLSGQFFTKDGQQQLNTGAIEAYQTAAEVRALISPDEASVKKLLSAGEAARTMKNFPKAISYFDMIIQKFPQMKGASQALFLKAFTMDNDLKQYDRAKGIYEAFLQKYPEDGFADDVQFLLENLGATNEEIIQKFDKADSKK